MRMVRRSTSWFLILVGALAVVAIDQLTKQWAIANLSQTERIAIVGDALGLHLVFNPGAAFSLGANSTRVITVIALVVVLAVFPALAARVRHRWIGVGLALMWGGAAGNLIDRIFFEPGGFAGHVVDFIAYFDWFVGNVADIALVAGAVIMIVVAFFMNDGAAAGSADSGATPDTAALPLSQLADTVHPSDSVPAPGGPERGD